MRVIYFFFIVMTISNVCSSQIISEISFKDFALKFDPANIISQDTFAVSRLPSLTESMNDFISNNKEAEEYVLLVFLKMCKNHLIVNNMSYDYCYDFDSSLTDAIISYCEFDIEMPCHELNDYFIYSKIWKKRRKLRLTETRQLLDEIKDIREDW